LVLIGAHHRDLVRLGVRDWIRIDYEDDDEKEDELRQRGPRGFPAGKGEKCSQVFQSQY